MFANPIDADRKFFLVKERRDEQKKENQGQPGDKPPGVSQIQGKRKQDTEKHPHPSFTLGNPWQRQGVEFPQAQEGKRKNEQKKKPGGSVKDEKDQARG
jgi:hypothetical protein